MGVPGLESWDHCRDVSPTAGPYDECTPSLPTWPSFSTLIFIPHLHNRPSFDTLASYMCSVPG